MFTGIINLFYPPVCHVCDKKMAEEGKALCGDCIKRIRVRKPPFCLKCGKSFGNGIEDKITCLDCRTGKLYYDKAFSALYYEENLKKVILILKYGKITSLAGELSDIMSRCVGEKFPAMDTDLVLSIPMHPLRLLKREINASHILAREVAKKLCIPYSDRVLKKTSNTGEQSKLKRNERLKNLKGSFAVRKEKVGDIAGKNLLIVDDLFTTGATVNECSRVLKKAGSGKIKVLTLARADILN